MINRYKKTITSILDKLHNARKKPFEKIGKWLVLQEILIKKIIYVENQIRKQKKEINSLNKFRKDPNKRISKTESVKIKESIKYKEYQIEEYKWILLIYNSIGDGIAFTFLDKFDIKPQSFKESPGFISGKKGITNEKRILRYLFSKGKIAIFNDITSVLNYGDIMLITEKGPVPIEIKTSYNVNSRILRQQEKSKKLYKYLAKDIVEDLYDTGIVMQRVEMVSPEINYIEQLNSLIEKADKSGIAYSLIEKGLLYFVSYNEFSKEKLDNVFFEYKLKNSFVFHINMFKFIGQGYYPFSLIFKKTKYYWDFLEGKINILVFIDFETIEAISKDNGFNVQRSQEHNWAFDFKSVSDDNPESEFKMSEHYFFRTFMEFVSVQWLIKNSFNIVLKNM